MNQSVDAGHAVSEPHEIVFEGYGTRAVAMDSITHASEEFGPGDILIGSSFGGIVAIQFALRFKPRAIIAHDCGVGLAGSGINGLWFMDALGIPAATVAGSSARIADGMSVWSEGIISHVNYTARAMGCRAGQTTAEAVEVLARCDIPDMFAAGGELPFGGRVEVAEVEGIKIVGAGSIRFGTQDDGDTILCLGSHSGATAARRALAVRPGAMICSDGGRGKDDSGISGLPMMDRYGIPAAAVDVATAVIGDGVDTYENGIISAANEAAQAAGVRVGQPAREAAACIARTLAARRRGAA